MVQDYNYQGPLASYELRTDLNFDVEPITILEFDKNQFVHGSAKTVKGSMF